MESTVCGPEERKGNAEEPDFRDIKGHLFLRRGLEVAAAGGHHVFLFGPPGSGKTMAGIRMPSILPDLSPDEAIEVTRNYILCGKSLTPSGLITRPPLRIPCHTASLEKIIGGGRNHFPGEISLAHRGILFLDSVSAFGAPVLQSLLTPLVKGRADMVCSGIRYRYPARFQLVMSSRPCPCGNLGKPDNSCFCSMRGIRKYWAETVGILMDRIDIRIPAGPVKSGIPVNGAGERSSTIQRRVAKAAEIQKTRFRERNFSRNSEIPVSSLMKYCVLSDRGKEAFTRAAEKLGLSSCACHAVLRIGRTIADLEGKLLIGKEHVYEAVQHRRYGDGDYFWRR